MRKDNAEYLLQIECSQAAHSDSTQRPESIQTGAKRLYAPLFWVQVRIGKLFRVRSLVQ
jgi:hypothetical protein